MSLPSTLARVPISKARANVLGVGVHAIDVSRALEFIENAIAESRKGYVCVTGVHGVMEAQRDSEFRNILNNAMLVTPDGMPTVWVGRLQGHSHMRRVFGPDLMLEVFKVSAAKGYRHFLYGGAEGVAEQLQSNLTEQFPGVQVVGTYTPPFRPLLWNEQAELEQIVRETSPDIIWVGLSTPKQERFMAQNIDRLSCRLMIGVGAAFDIHTGRVNDAPQWIKQAGLQWLHRLFQEPSRLWKRYLINNSLFSFKIAFQITGLKQYEVRSRNECRSDQA